MARVARHIFVSGRVQGVAFRWYTQEKATRLGVSGWARNLRDGRVEAHLEGEDAAMKTMLAWLKKGPGLARVTNLDVREREPEGYGAFEIRPSFPV